MKRDFRSGADTVLQLEIQSLLGTEPGAMEYYNTPAFTIAAANP
jgi:hypothetical protein